VTTRRETEETEASRSVKLVCASTLKKLVKIPKVV
jgi:hypothetical protein